MGYSSRVDGGFTIEPPLTAQEIRKFPESPSRGKYLQDEIGLEITEDIRETPEGDLHYKTAYELRPLSPDSDWSRSRTPEQIQAVVDAYPDHAFEGYMEFCGEDGALWRLYVVDRKVVEVKPTILWETPDGVISS